MKAKTGNITWNRDFGTNSSVRKALIPPFQDGPMEKASKEGGFLTESYGEGKREIKQESGVPGQQGDSFRHGKPYQQGKEVTAREQLQAHGRPGPLAWPSPTPRCSPAGLNAVSTLPCAPSPFLSPYSNCVVQVSGTLHLNFSRARDLLFTDAPPFLVTWYMRVVGTQQMLSEW